MPALCNPGLEPAGKQSGDDYYVRVGKSLVLMMHPMGCVLDCEMYGDVGMRRRVSIAIPGESLTFSHNLIACRIFVLINIHYCEHITVCWKMRQCSKLISYQYVLRQRSRKILAIEGCSQAARIDFASLNLSVLAAWDPLDAAVESRAKAARMLVRWT